jgi:hypothetical protein
VIQEYTGKASYYPDHGVDTHQLLVGIACLMEPLPRRMIALFDTAAEWCVLPPTLRLELGIEVVEGEGDVFLSTRFGTVQGRLERVDVTLHASEGDPLTIDATCFVSAQWPGPLVLGWRGCLERMNFGFNNSEAAFYFAPPGG